MRALVVEDNVAQLNGLAEIIEESFPDIECLKAACYDDALALVDSHSIQLFLLDIQLGADPDKDGIKLGEQLRRNPRYQTTPILYVTALGKRSSQSDPQDQLLRLSGQALLTAGSDRICLQAFEVFSDQGGTNRAYRQRWCTCQDQTRQYTDTLNPSCETGMSTQPPDYLYPQEHDSLYLRTLFNCIWRAATRALS